MEKHIVYLFYAAVTSAGAGLGYLYYKKVGCQGNVCPMWSSPGRSMFFGALLGLVIAKNLLR